MQNQEEHAQKQIKQILDQVTNENITEKVNEVLPYINSPEMEKAFVGIFFPKVLKTDDQTKYIKLIKELSSLNDILKSKITSTFYFNFKDYMLNPVEKDDDEGRSISKGISTFLALLISNGLLSCYEERLFSFCIDCFKEPYGKLVRADMIKNFLQLVGNHFIQSINKKEVNTLRNLKEEDFHEPEVTNIIIDILGMIDGDQNTHNL